jgi:hypothetical protein
VSEVVNLNKVRKTRSREAARESAAANRIVFGRTKPERDQARALEAQAAKRLDQARRDEP